VTKPKRRPEDDEPTWLGFEGVETIGGRDISPCRPGHRGHCGIPDCPRCGAIRIDPFGALPNMRPDQFLAAAQAVASRFPDCELVKNQVGNLSILLDGEQIGWVDLRYGEVTMSGDGD
jgi:hypothetical protein